MKKFLSLVLTLVMTMSLVTVSAGANDYADADEITYVEAVDVLSELGILQGDANGFRPTDTLKRSEAAKIICALNLTPDVAAELSADAAPFADVPASHWAAGYVAEGVQSGIIAGIGGGKFAPDAELTGYAYLKMLLVSLGYDASAENLTGANWSINVAKLAKKIGLTKGNDKFIGTKAVTREEAALYAVNALQADIVEYPETGSSITIGDVVITTNKGTAASTEVSFMADVYEDLKLTKKGADALGRPANVWKLDGDEIGTYAATADYTVTLTKTVKDLCDYLDDEDILTDAVYADDAAYRVNGEKAAADSALKAGSVVEIYADGEEVTNVAVINYSLAKIEKVSTSLKKAEKADGATAKLTVAGKAVLDIDIAGYDEETYVKGAYILYVMNDDNEIVASMLAESVEGKVSAMKSGDAKIDGEYYDVVGAEGVKKGAEGTFYLNAAGQIILFVAADEATSDEYAYIYNTKSLDGETNDDGYAAEDGLKVYVILADGTKASYVVEEDSVAKVKVGEVVPYTINDDDEFEVVKAGSKIEIEAVTDSVSKSDAVIDGIDVLSTTEFVFCDYDAKDKVWDVETATGYKNVKIADEDMIVVSDDGEAVYVFVIAANGKLTTDTAYAVILDAEAEEWTEDKKDRFTYTVAIEGEEETLTSATALKVVEGDVISYELEDELMVNVKVLDAKTVTSANDDYFRAGARYEFNGEEELYTITMEYTDGELDYVAVDNDAVIEKDDKVIVVLDSDDDLAIVFVYEVID